MQLGEALDLGAFGVRPQITFDDASSYFQWRDSGGVMIFMRVLSALACLLAFDVEAQARASFKACVDRASMDSAHYPQRIDRETTITGVGCRQEAGRVIYVYDNALSIQKSKLPKGSLESLKITGRNMVCTNPSLKALLQLVDMEYTFYDSASVYIGTITHRIEDCTAKVAK